MFLEFLFRRPHFGHSIYREISITNECFIELISGYLSTLFSVTLKCVRSSERMKNGAVSEIIKVPFITFLASVVTPFLEAN